MKSSSTRILLRRLKVFVGTLLLCGASFQNVVADEPILIFAISSGSPPTEVTVGSNNIRGIVAQINNRQNEFIPFDGVDFTASLSYLGVGNSVGFEFAGDGLSAVVTIPYANFRRRFTASDPRELTNQLTAFLEADGSAQLATLRKFVNQVSPVGVTDGNPYSTTALSSRSWVDAFNDVRDMELDASDENETKLSFEFSRASYHAGAFSGTLSNGRITAVRSLFDSVQLVATLPFNYQTVDASEVHGVGGGLGLPVTLFQFEKEQPFQLVTAPFGGGMLRVSKDLASGGGVMHYGIYNSLSYRVNESLSLSAIAQYAGYYGIPLHFEEFELDSKVGQDLVTLGFEMTYRFKKRLSFDGHVHQMDYLRDAGVGDWVNLGAGLNINITEQTDLRCSYEHIKGSDFTANRYALSLALRF